MTTRKRPKMNKAYHVKVANNRFNFTTLTDAMTFAQKESWDKAQPTIVIKPDGQSIEVNVSTK